MNGQDRDDITRKICDKQTFDAINLLRSINLDKSKKVEAKIKAYFEKSRALVTYEIYQALVKDLDLEPVIFLQRRSNNYGLDDIDDDV